MSRMVGSAAYLDWFWERVLQSGAGECWPWAAGMFSDGYGAVHCRRGVLRKAHRVAYELAAGMPIAQGAMVLHSCDNPPCCNPAHLYQGDALQNAKDRNSRGRANACQGERHGGSKLTSGDVAALRALASRRTMSHAAIGKVYGISQTHVSSIVRGAKWRATYDMAR